MRRIWSFALPKPHAALLLQLQAQWSSDPVFRQQNPEWREEVWRGPYRTFLQRLHGGHCAFCETNVTGGSQGQVEHFIPKKRYHLYKFDWSNWLLSCSNCNKAKGQRDTRRSRWLDPRKDDPWQYLSISPTGALVPKGTKEHVRRAKRTIKGTDLNCARTKRSDQLKDQRQAAIAKLERLIQARPLTPSQTQVAIDEAIVEECTDPHSQFSGLCLCHLSDCVKKQSVPKALFEKALARMRAKRPKKQDVFR